MSTVTEEELRDVYGKTWELCSLPTWGAAAWRRSFLPCTSLTEGRENVLLAGSLDALKTMLAQQEAIQDSPQKTPITYPW